MLSKPINASTHEERNFYRVEKALLHKMSMVGLANQTVASVNFRGSESALVIHIDGSWSVKNTAGSYVINNPFLDKLLEKFALITNNEFQDQVGDNNSNDYECNRQRLLDLEKLLRKNKPQLLAQLTEKLRLLL